MGTAIIYFNYHEFNSYILGFKQLACSNFLKHKGKCCAFETLITYGILLK